MTKPKRFTINVAISAEVRAALDEVAKAQQTGDKQRFASDVVREAIEQYLNRLGYDVCVDVDRGGWRGGPKEQPNLSSQAPIDVDPPFEEKPLSHSRSVTHPKSSEPQDKPRQKANTASNDEPDEVQGA